jgi:3-hydroxyisobutyrate dehydrogenase-like beta-hydroxyacid dehydrogenase
LKIAFIGFGEAARAFAQTLREDPDLELCAFDRLQHNNDDPGHAIREAAEALGVTLSDDAVAAARDAQWVFSAVTAADSLDAGRSVATSLGAGQTFFDINSVSAGRKLETAALVCGHGGAYVDMAVMAPVHPRGHRTPVLLAGPSCNAVTTRLAELGFSFSVVGEEVGAATSIKMLRSLFVKGMEAVTVQTLLAAKAAGRFDEVYASLSASFPQLGWPDYPAYQLERVSRHGVRRAAEMQESAVTLDELGFSAGRDLAAAIADFQGTIGQLGFAADENGDVSQLYEGLLAAFRDR